VSNVIGMPKAEASDLRKIIDKFMRSLPEHIEMLKIMARMDFEQFQAYVKAGFNPEQAMDLIRAGKIKANV